MSQRPHHPFKPIQHAKTGACSITARKPGFGQQSPAVQAPQSSPAVSDAERRVKRGALLDKLSKTQKTLDIIGSDTLTNNVTLPVGRAGQVMAKTVYSKITASTAQLKTASMGIDVVEIRRALDFMSEIPVRIWSKLDSLQGLVATLRSQSHTINYVAGRFMEELSSLQGLLSQALTQAGELMSSIYNWTKAQLRKVHLPAKINAALEAIETWASTVSKVLPKLWKGVKELFGPLGIFIDLFQIELRVDNYNADTTGNNFDKLVIECLGLVVDLVMWGVPAVCVVFLGATLPAWVGWALLVYAVVNLIYVLSVEDGQDLLATLVYRIGESIINVAKWVYQQAIVLGQQLGRWAKDLYETGKARIKAWLAEVEEAALRWAKQQGEAVINDVEKAAEEAWQKLHFPLPNF